MTVHFITLQRRNNKESDARCSCHLENIDDFSMQSDICCVATWNPSLRFSPLPIQNSRKNTHPRCCHSTRHPHSYHFRMIYYP